MSFDSSNLVVVKDTKLFVVLGSLSRTVSNPLNLNGYCWKKPKNASYIYLMCLGGGSGGGAGAAGATATGGAGGAMGAFSRLLIHADMLPNELWLYPGYGGAGDVTGDGFDAMISAITDKVNTQNTVADTILQSGVVTSSAGALGGAGGAAVQASGRASESINTNVRGPYQGSGLWFASNTSQTGENGGAATGAAGSNTSAWGSLGCPTGEGAGGGSWLGSGPTAGAGGNVTAGGRFTARAGGAANTSGAGGDGPAGARGLFPFQNTGGGGGGAGSTTGGAGGAGGYGCGGGGGGGGGTTGGHGGDGGPGLIWIQWW